MEGCGGQGGRRRQKEPQGSFGCLSCDGVDSLIMTDLVLPDDFPVNARGVVKDLFEPNPVIYWTDFMFHVVLGWTAFFASLWLPTFSPLQLVSLVVASLSLYRAGIFIHELSHFKRGE